MLFTYLVIKPSYTIPKLVFVNAPESIKSQVIAGETLIFKWPIGIIKMNIDQAEMTRFNSKYALGVIGLNYFKTSYLVGQYKLESGHAFRAPLQKIFIHPINVEYIRPERRSAIRLPASVLKKMSAHDEKTRALEREKMSDIFSKLLGKFGGECWQRPLNSKVVSKFGSPRTLPSGRHYYHLGVDLRAQTAIKIKASASGYVAYADHMTVPGNMVILNHGDRVFSRYMHLSEFKVKEGDKVKKGQIIGLTGATGRVEAPHLHWEVLWKGNHADPLRFVAAMEQICDRE